MVYVQIQDRAVTPVHVHRGSQAQCVRWRWMIVKTYPVSMEDLVRMLDPATNVNVQMDSQGSDVKL